MSRKDPFTRQRNEMVEDQIFRRGVHSERVLEAMRTIPRHCFIPPEYQEMAYTDGPLPIGKGQTISQPYIVALMTALLDLQGDETVLEVGTGSGYQAAILARLARQVHTIERHARLAQVAEQILTSLGIDNVIVHVGDGTQGLPEYAPFGGIIVTAAAPRVPAPLLRQLSEGGRLVIPVGSRAGQVLECWQRQGEEFKQENVLPVAFVPLIGLHGWRENQFRDDFD